ncbi:hypothetical protein GCM10009733_059940 [Nonomuraea maheshkhaliensis]|uniref:VTT domain-containing protein n=1 Tax=Nonomuraea maheshkhaliensis TaxID=419590 RepID=A0ABP4RLK8_9ACTN
MLDDVLTGWSGQEPFTIGLLLFLLLAAEGSLLIGLLVPGDLAVVVAGAAVARPVELGWVVLGGMAGCFAGATGGYLLGRAFGGRVRRGGAGVWVGEQRWRRAEEFVAGTGGGLSLALAYFIPGVHALTPVLAGMLGIPYRRFIRCAMAGASAWVTAYVVVGSVTGEAAREHQGLLIPMMAAVALLVAAVAVGVERLVTGRRRGVVHGRGPRLRRADAALREENGPRSSRGRHESAGRL